MSDPFLPIEQVIEDLCTDPVFAAEFLHARQAIALRLKEQGMVLVPREPTQEMLQAGTKPWMMSDLEHSVVETWKAMIDAAKEANDL